VRLSRRDAELHLAADADRIEPCHPSGATLELAEEAEARVVQSIGRAHETDRAEVAEPRGGRGTVEVSHDLVARVAAHLLEQFFPRTYPEDDELPAPIVGCCSRRGGGERA